ncbi:MAG: MFS transporter [Rubrivivax sp.]|nr:MFS transporter [Rubrivivax sp.]
MAEAAPPPHRARADPALVVLLAGVAAALHVGKLPPAVTALQDALGLTLVQAGFLLSLVQAAGMAFGIAFGALADGLGARRSMLGGLALLALASALGGAATGAGALMLLRAVEGFGFLLVVLPGPALLRELVPPERSARVMGLWGAYMPLATALALLLGPAVIALAGWRTWWALLALVSAAVAGVLARAVPAAAGPAAAPRPLRGLAARLARTLSASGPWLLCTAFAVYAAQWLAVIGFLPTVYAAAGMAGVTTAVATALAALVNVAGNLAAGRWLQRGASPLAPLALGFAVMGLASIGAFHGAAGDPDAGLPLALRYACVLAFSAFGGLVPATLFALAVRLAPDAGSTGTTVGWMQQGSAAGQFAGPPLAAWVASQAGGWHRTWWVTAACAGAGLLLAWALARRAGHAARAASPGVR